MCLHICQCSDEAAICEAYEAILAVTSKPELVTFRLGGKSEKLITARPIYSTITEAKRKSPKAETQGDFQEIFCFRAVSQCSLNSWELSIFLRIPLALIHRVSADYWRLRRRPSM